MTERPLNRAHPWSTSLGPNATALLMAAVLDCAERGTVGVAMIAPGGDGEGMKQSTSVRRLVDAMLDQAKKDRPGVEFMLWLPSLEGLLLPRDSDCGGERDAAVSPRMRHYCYRGRRIPAFDDAYTLITR